MKLNFIKIKIVAFYIPFILSILVACMSNAYATANSISSTPMQYHKVTLDWNGPSRSESSATFNNFRLNVTFTSPSGKTYLVPGYFAADGDAAESSANSGNKWRAHINPQETGTWSYSASFRSGTNVAINLNTNAGSPVANSFNGSSGTFNVSPTNKSGLDFRGKGKLQYVGEHFLQFSNQEYFIKVAANSPEVFLQYEDFDNTNSNRDYADHANDWDAGDPEWKANLGTEIIGVVNYLSEIGINENYFLTMNIEGDGRQAYPYVDDDEPNVFDVSKLAQWQIVFDHMMSKGVMTHFVMTETENENWFEYNADQNGNIIFADTRKLYYREMVARFGYLNAITWDIGEENGWQANGNNQFGNQNSTEQRIAFADYLDDLNPYADHIVIHNNPSVPIHEQLLSEGATSYTGASFQIQLNRPEDARSRMKTLIADSATTSPPMKWVVAYDEPFIGNLSNTNAQVFREDVIWNTFMLGGAGVGLYIGGGDLQVQDYREFSDYWEAMVHAYDFFVDNNIPFWRMSDADDLTNRGFALAEEGQVYVVYLPDGGAPNVDLTGADTYEIFWYNPRTGGNLQKGSISEVEVGANVSLGNPPSDASDEWVVFARIMSESEICVPIKSENDAVAVICL